MYHAEKTYFISLNVDHNGCGHPDTSWNLRLESGAGSIGVIMDEEARAREAGEAMQMAKQLRPEATGQRGI